jgi:glycosyltransferase involved in cell wall biosynthesis
MGMRVSVIITTYNQPEQLEKVMWGYAGQRGAQFELIIADDGSLPATTEVIDRVAAATGLDVLHLWHEDKGFRKTEILNRATAASRGDYLIFSDGDCIPRDDFVATHVRLSSPNSFLSGGYIKLSAAISHSLTIADVVSRRATDARTLLEKGWRPGRRALRLVRNQLVATLMDSITPTRRTWNGHNSSATRAAIIEANGFDMDMGYGGEDRALGERLMNAGINGKQIRHRAPCVHLFHDRPYVDPIRWKLNHEIRNRIRENGETRARIGIAELSKSDDLLVRRPGQLLEPRGEQRVVMAR